jgi:hypothetical protein
MAENRLSTQIGHRISLPGHFDVPVILEDVRALGTDGSAAYECRVRLPDGTLEEEVIQYDLPRRGTVLLEERDPGTSPRLPFYPEFAIHDATFLRKDNASYALVGRFIPVPSPGGVLSFGRHSAQGT